MKHYSVLLKETIENLNIKNDGIYVDTTLGYAGHSKNILKNISNGFLYAFDADQEAIDYSQKELEKYGTNFKIFHSNFKNMKEKLLEENVSYVDGIIFDLGVSSPQIDEAERGFSFMNDGLLDMRMDKSQKFSAYDVVNTYSKEDLMDMFYTYGEEEKSKFIAEEIIKYRGIKKIETTKELVDVIKSSVGAKYFNLKHPERQIFQAIRIEVNNELNVLESVLPDAINLLNKGGRICVITFHSLEDRIVKRIFKKYSEVDALVKGLPVIPEEYKPLIKVINKKPILATVEETKENSRSKSAKLRVIERV
jgi:16S rRNA (cytosine1402-N4)-methyltransferase